MSVRNNTGNIKAENKKISDDFINLVTDMFGVIDEVSQQIGDGKYLELANQFKKLSEFKEKMGTNIVYIEHEKRTHMRVLSKKQRRLTYAEKLKNTSKYYKCCKCDCVLTKREKKSHEKTQKCKRIYSSRMITLSNKTKINSKELILLDDMLDTRRPYIMIEGFDDKIKTEKKRLFTMEDYYSDDTENAVVMIQKLFRGKSVRKDKREKQMFDMIKAFIERKKRNMIMSRRLKNCWGLYRSLSKEKNKKYFNECRREICEINGFKIKGVSKMSRREIEMEMARQLFR
jgi:hypothetical protein